MGSSRLFNDPYTPSPTLPSSSHPYERGHLCNLLFPPYLTYINPIPSQFPHSSLPFHLSQAKLSPSPCSHSLMRLKRRALEEGIDWRRRPKQEEEHHTRRVNNHWTPLRFQNPLQEVGWQHPCRYRPWMNVDNGINPLLDLTYSANENWTSAIVVLTRFCCE